MQNANDKNYRTYDIDELTELAEANTPTRVSLILDEKAVDFLLSLRRDDDPVDENEIDELAESIEDEVLQTVGTLTVADEELTDGRRRLLAIKSLGYPQSLCATVVFGGGEGE